MLHGLNITGKKGIIVLMPLVLLAGAVCGVKPVISLITAAGMAILFLNLNRLELMYKITLVFYISIPLVIFDTYRLRLPFVKITAGEFEFLFIGIILLARAAAKKLQSERTPVNPIYFLMLAVLAVYAFMGIYDGNPSISTDLRIFGVYTVYMLSSVILSKQKDILGFMIKFNIVVSILISLLVIVMFFNKPVFSALFSNTFYSNDQRVGYGNMACFVFCVPIIILAVMNRMVNKTWRRAGISALVLVAASSVISESRALLMAVLVNAFISVAVYYFLFKREQFVKNIGKFTFAVVVFLAVIYAIFNFGISEGNQKLMSLTNRFTELSAQGEVRSISARSITNSNTWKQITDKKLGHGLGAEIASYNANSRFYGNVNYVDNAAITLLYKVGFPGFIVMLAFFLPEFFNIFLLYRRSRQYPVKVTAFCLFLCIPAYLLNGAYFTAQIVMNTSAVAYTLTTFVFIRLLLRNASEGESHI